MLGAQRVVVAGTEGSRERTGGQREHPHEKGRSTYVEPTSIRADLSCGMHGGVINRWQRWLARAFDLHRACRVDMTSRAFAILFFALVGLGLPASNAAASPFVITLLGSGGSGGHIGSGGSGGSGGHSDDGDMSVDGRAGSD